MGLRRGSLISAGFLHELGEEIPVWGERSGIHVTISTSQDFNGHPESEIRLAQVVGVESFLTVGLGGQAVEVSEYHTAHRTSEEIPDVVSLASVNGGALRKWCEVVVSNGVDVRRVSMDYGQVKGDFMIVDELSEGNCTVERVCSRFWMCNEQARAMKVRKRMVLAMLI